MRWIVDNEFCCDEHRLAARTSSARSVRECRDLLDEYDEFSSPGDPKTEPFAEHRAVPAPAPPSRKSSSNSNALMFLLILGVGGGILALNSGTATERARRASTPGGVRDFIRTHSAVRLQADFRSGMTYWIPPRAERASPAPANGWEWRSGFLKPGGFRVWRPSMDLTDYQLDFAASIERKAVNWTYRTQDAANFYAGRLVVTRPGPLPQVELVRYARVNGEELKRAATRLPMVARADTLYRVEVKLDGADITTRVNGAIVDTWSDRRFASGGVGFFSNPDEVALLRYVNVTQQDNFLGRLLAHFGLIHPSFFRLP